MMRNVLLPGTVWHALAYGAFGAAPNSTVCLDDESFAPPFNSTGSMPFVQSVVKNDDGKPWYVSVAFKDTANGNSTSPGGYARIVAVSLPNDFVSSTEKNATRMCTYTFPEQNSKFKHDGSCDGVLSDACFKSIHALQQDLRFPENGCPKLGDKVEACGDMFSLDPIDLAAEQNCTSGLGSALPEVPTDYHSYEILNKMTPTHHRLDMPKEFDAQIGMPVPVLVLFSLQQDQDGQPRMQHSSQLLCVAPVNVTKGDQAFGSGSVNLRASQGSLMAIVAVVALGGFLL